MSSIFDDVKDYKENLLNKPDFTYSGLVIFCFIICILDYELILPFLEGNGIILTFKERTSLYSGSSLLYGLYWFHLRRGPIFKTGENGIFFAFNKIDSKTEDTLNILYQKMIASVESENISSKIKIKILPSHISVLNEKQAALIRRKSKAKVLIWGNVERGTINGKNKDLCFNNTIRFTFEHRLNRQGLYNFNKNISKIILRKDWSINESEQIIDRDYVVNNMKEISLYFIGWVLVLSPVRIDIDAGIEILGRIFVKYKEKIELDYDEKILVSKIEWLIGEYFAINFFNINPRIRDKNKGDKIERAKQLLEGVKDINIDKKYYILDECIINLLEGNISLAFENAEIATKITGGSSPFYSLAFLNYYTGKLGDGFANLKKAIGRNVPFDLLLIVEWYQEALSEDREKKYLNFPIGQIYYNLLKEADPQRSIAQESLSKFVDDYQMSLDPTILKMIDEASLMLKKIK
jgi:hypothetical protein